MQSIERRRREAMHDQRRGSGVADAHFAKRNDAGTGVDFVDRELAAARQRLHRLLPRHRRFARGVGRAHSDFRVDQVLVCRQFGGDTGIDHPDRGVGGRGKRVGAGAAGEVRRNHQCRHRGGILRDAFLGQAVIAGEHQQHGFPGGGRAGMRDRPELDREILDPAERSRRFRLAVDTRPNPGSKCLIRRYNLRRLPAGWGFGGHRVPSRQRGR